MVKMMGDMTYPVDTSCAAVMCHVQLRLQSTDLKTQQVRLPTAQRHRARE